MISFFAKFSRVCCSVRLMYFCKLWDSCVKSSLIIAFCGFVLDCFLGSYFIVIG